MSDAKTPSIFDRIGIRPIDAILIVGLGWMILQSQAKPAPSPGPIPGGLSAIVTDSRDRATLAAAFDAASLAVIVAPPEFDTHDELSRFVETLGNIQIKGRLTTTYAALPAAIATPFAQYKQPGPLTAAERQSASASFKSFAEQLR